MTKPHSEWGSARRRILQFNKLLKIERIKLIINSQ